MVDSQMKQDSMLVQKNFTFAAFFMPFYLALPNNCVNTHTHTHTHTHTFERPLFYIKERARVIYNINTCKQRVCKKFLITSCTPFSCGN